MKTRRSRSMALASALALLVGVALLGWGTTAEAGPCGAGKFPASGQTTADTAILQGGISAVSVPDDGTVQAGADLRYKDNGDGTITDRNTGLVWEKKCSDCGGLHDVSNTYVWSNSSTPGADMTIWDWLEAVNAEGGKGFAKHHDWRIPNVRELQSIVDYGRCAAAYFASCNDEATINPIFGPTAIFYWSSSTNAINPSYSWDVAFIDGAVIVGIKDKPISVRAVRAGCAD